MLLGCVTPLPEAAPGAPETTPPPNTAAPPELPPAPGREGTITAEERRFLAEYVDSLRFVFRPVAGAVQDSPAATEGAGDAPATAPATESEPSPPSERPGDEPAALPPRDLLAATGRFHGVRILEAGGLAAAEADAGVYLDLEVDVESAMSGESYYARARVTVESYDSGDDSLLYTAVRLSAPTLSRVSPEDAALNAVRSGVDAALPAAIRGTRERVGERARRGVPYRLILREPASWEVRRAFLRRVEGLDVPLTLRERSGEILYLLRYYGYRADIIDEVTLSGEGRFQILETKGNTLIFTTGSD